MSARLAMSLVVLAGCGTYSMVRPASTLKHHDFELAAGLAASSLEANTIGHAAYGVTDRVEVLAQNEVWNTFGEVRFALLREDRAPVSLTVGAGGGFAMTLLSAITSNDMTVNGAAGTTSIAVGRDFGRTSLTLGNRTFFLAAGYLASSTRAALRVRVFGKAGFFVEGGATYHAALAVPQAGLLIGEGAGGLYVGF